MTGGRRKFGLLTFFLSMLLILDFVCSRSYPVFVSKRFANAGSPRLPALGPFLFSAYDLPRNFELTDYDDNYLPYGQVDYESEYYPLSPVYGYARDRTGGDSIVDFEEAGYGERDYPFGRDGWYNDEGERDESADFMRNMVVPEMNQEPREGDAGSQIMYRTPVLFSPDNGPREREQTWYYGVPVYEEREDTLGGIDNGLRELGVLTRDTEGEVDDAPTDVEPVPYHEDEAYWDQWQKRMSRSGRKNSIPLRQGWKMNQKRFYAPEKSSSKTGAIQSRIRKAIAANGRNEIEATASTPRPKEQPTGQKEYVLNRPANPARKPIQKSVYVRNGKKTDAYDAIKKLIAMEGGIEKEKRPRIQKRFVLSEDQLTSQLNGLKRISV